MPVNAKDYVHRVGRTARAGRMGTSITFVTQYDVEMFKRIEELVKVRMPAHPLEESDVLTLLPQVEAAEKLANEEIKKERGKEKRRKQNRADGGKKREDAPDTEAGSAYSYAKKAKVNKRKIE